MPMTGATIGATPLTSMRWRKLRVLRAAWSRELATVLGEERDAVAQCVELLSHLEQRFITDDRPA